MLLKYIKRKNIQNRYVWYNFIRLGVPKGHDPTLHETHINTGYFSLLFPTSGCRDVLNIIRLYVIARVITLICPCMVYAFRQTWKRPSMVSDGKIEHIFITKTRERRSIPYISLFACCQAGDTHACVHVACIQHRT